MKELENIKKQFNELMGEVEKLVKKLKKKTEDKPWRAEKGETYYLVKESANYSDGILGVFRDTEDGTTYDTERYELGNYFKTAEEAGKAAQHFSYYLILKRDTKGFEPDWSDIDEEKCHIHYDARNGTLTVNYQYSSACGDIYFRTRKDALASIEKHGDIWKRYLGVD